MVRKIECSADTGGFVTINQEVCKKFNVPPLAYRMDGQTGWKGQI